jgi:3-oxoacyl-[acyl-carrier-protein] synthase II
MRICVTGVGVVSSLALGAKATFDAICAGKRGIEPVSLFDVSGQRSTFAAQVRSLPPAPPSLLSVTSSPLARTDRFAILAVQEALDQAGLTSVEGLDLVFGSTTGPSLETEDAIADLASNCPIPAQLAPLVLHPIAQSAQRLREHFGLSGKSRCISSACSTGLNAIILGSIWIRSGRSSRVLVGASDALCRLTFTGFNALGALDLAPCRPFDISRAGLSLGEGAAFLVLESEQSARQRGAQVLAEVGGFGLGAEAHHITQPDPSATLTSRIIANAIASSALNPSDIDFVNAHGTATPLNDPMEIKALGLAMGERIGSVPVFSNKGHLGHTLGAAGAMEAVLSIMSLQSGCLTPTAGLSTVDPSCAAAHVMGEPRVADLRIGLSNSFGFGGLDSSLVLARPGCLPDLASEPKRRVFVVSAATADLSGCRSVREQLPSAHANDFDPLLSLDPSKARRLWRTEQWLCCALESARKCLDSTASQDDSSSFALVAGLPNGSIDGASRFLHRSKTRGARSVSPADFPNLMLSSSAGHTSIYHHIQGPVIASTELDTSSEAALVTAFELVLSHVSPLCAAVAGEGSDSAASRIRQPSLPPVSEGASALILGFEPLRGSDPVELLRAESWTSPSSRCSILDSIHPRSANDLLLRLGCELRLPARLCGLPTEHADATAQPLSVVASALRRLSASVRSVIVLIDRGDFGAVFQFERRSVNEN